MGTPGKHLSVGRVAWETAKETAKETAEETDGETV